MYIVCLYFVDNKLYEDLIFKEEMFFGIVLFLFLFLDISFGFFGGVFYNLCLDLVLIY